MTSGSRTALLGTIAAAATLTYAAAAVAQSLPKNWNYEIKDGKRVPKAERLTTTCLARPSTSTPPVCPTPRSPPRA